MLFQRPYHALRVIRPAILVHIQGIQGKLDDALPREIRRVQPHLIGTVSACGCVGAYGQCARKNMPAVIIDMFTDKVYTPGREENVRSGCAVKYVLHRCFQGLQYFIHLFSPPFATNSRADLVAWSSRRSKCVRSTIPSGTVPDIPASKSVHPSMR